MIQYNWLSTVGEFENSDNLIIFKGGEIVTQEGMNLTKIGNYLCDKYFSEGKIYMDVEFNDNSVGNGCNIILNYFNRDNKLQMVCVGINRTMAGLFEVKSFRDNEWKLYQYIGDPNSFVCNNIYKLELEYIGSIIKLKVNGVDILDTTLPFSTSRSQVGIWTQAKKDITIHKFNVEETKPTAFIIMQFSDQFNELYSDVIKPICSDFNLKVVRADDIYNNDMIVNDITKNIIESKVIIADITPKNLNVYYEVGYSHALGKNTILLAEEGCELPFDVRPYRVIFYKNSITGKKHIEEQLKKHLNSVI